MRATSMKAGPRRLGHGSNVTTEGWALNADDQLTVFGVTMWNTHMLYSHGELAAVIYKGQAWVSDEISYYYRAISRLAYRHAEVNYTSSHELQNKLASILIQEAKEEMDRRLLGDV